MRPVHPDDARRVTPTRRQETKTIRVGARRRSPSLPPRRLSPVQCDLHRYLTSKWAHRNKHVSSCGVLEHVQASQTLQQGLNGSQEQWFEMMSWYQNSERGLSQHPHSCTQVLQVDDVSANLVWDALASYCTKRHMRNDQFQENSCSLWFHASFKSFKWNANYPHQTAFVFCFYRMSKPSWLRHIPRFSSFNVKVIPPPHKDRKQGVREEGQHAPKALTGPEPESRAPPGPPVKSYSSVSVTVNEPSAFQYSAGLYCRNKKTGINIHWFTVSCHHSDLKQLDDILQGNYL